MLLTAVQLWIRPSRLIGSSLLLGLCLSSFCSIAKAQNASARPVARLITAGPNYSRTRVTSDSTEATASKVSVSPSISDANDIERRAFEQTNRVREENGLPPLVWDASLCRMARLQSETMARQGFISHVSTDGARLRDRAREVGILHFSVLGENVAYNSGYEDPGGFAVERWMLSSGHRANILYAGFKAMAIGTFVGADGSVYLSQVFITR